MKRKKDSERETDRHKERKRKLIKILYLWKMENIILDFNGDKIACNLSIKERSTGNWWNIWSKDLYMKDWFKALSKNTFFFQFL